MSYASMPEQLYKKIDDIETKLDRITEALTTLARVEERQATAQEALGRAWKTIENLDHRIAELEKSQASTITRQGMWAAIVLLVGIIGYLSK